MEDYKKKYEEALEKAKSMMALPDDKAMIEEIFPELKESEDERIRQEIIYHIKNCDDTIDEDTEKRMIAWLEKKCEQTSKHFELKAGHWYICHRAFCCRADHLTVKEGERFMCEKDGVAKGFVIKEPEKYFKEVCAPAPIEDEQKPDDNQFTPEQAGVLDKHIDKFLEQKPADKVEPKFKVGDVMRTLQEAKDGWTDGMPMVVSIDDENYRCNNETIPIAAQENYEYPPMNRKQNPAWSEEDERIRIETIELLETANHPNVLHRNGKPLDFTENINWLKSLKDRVQPQPKQEWSEEDETICGMFIEMADSEPDENFYGATKERCSSWLKSLKDRMQPKLEWSEEDGRCIRYLIECLEVCVKGTAIKMLPSTAQKYIEWLKSLRPQKIVM